jgi:hypothetical protein
VIFREPLRVGHGGWSWWIEGAPSRGTADAYGPCHIALVTKAVVLGVERSTVTVIYQIRTPDGATTVFTQQWADGIGMVRSKEEVTEANGQQSFSEEEVLESNVQ